jgi:hypothetical protein
MEGYAEVANSPFELKYYVQHSWWQENRNDEAAIQRLHIEVRLRCSACERVHSAHPSRHVGCTGLLTWSRTAVRPRNDGCALHGKSDALLRRQERCAQSCLCVHAWVSCADASLQREIDQVVKQKTRTCETAREFREKLKKTRAG